MNALFMLTEDEANAPKPIKPQGIRLQDWEYYYEDLACWKATQAEKYLSGIKEKKDRRPE
jgi:hypothetical protein